MVIDDQNFKNKTSVNSSEMLSKGVSAATSSEFEIHLASPIDRLAAVVADFVLFWPLLALVTSPFARQAKEAKLLDNGDGYTDAIISAIALGAFALVLCQTVCISLFGATPGKWIFRLRVVSIWNHQDRQQSRPRPIDAFVRSIAWVLEAALCGLPWFAVFSNERRRPFHDRLSDCAVITLAPKKAAGLSSLPEMSIASGFQSAALAVITLCVTLSLTSFKRHQDLIADSVASREDEGRLCPEIREAIDESPGKKVSVVRDRLQTALTLFETDVLDTDCLVNEADFALWSGREQALAYLAKGLASTDDTKVAEYFEKACSREKSASDEIGVCAMVKLNSEKLNLDGFGLDDTDLVEQKTAAAKLESEIDGIIKDLSSTTPSYVRVASIQRLMQERNYEKALELINLSSDSRRVGAFLSEQRTKALYHLGRKTDARVAMHSSSDLLDTTSRMRVAQWFCYNEALTEGCSAETKSSCAPLVRGVETFEGWLKKPDVAIAYVRSQACDARDSATWDLLKEKVSSNDAKTYVEALQMVGLGKRKEATAKFKSLLESSSGEHGAFFLEANLRLTELSANRQELAPVIAQWGTLDSAEESWQPLGQALIEKLTALQSWNDAMRVGLKLSKQDKFDRRTLELMVVAANAAGNKHLALGMLENALKLKPSVEASRAPASVKDFEQVSAALLKESAP